MKTWKKIVTASVFALSIAAIAKTDAQAASKITNVKQINATDDSIQISWDAGLGSDRYKIEISQDKTTWVVADDTSDTRTYINNLSAGRSYYVRVSGYKDWSWSTETGTLLYETSTPIDVVTSPEVPNANVVQSAATTTGFSVKFSNTAGTGANWYMVQLRNDVIVGQSANTTVKTNQKLEKATSYWADAFICRKSSSGFVALGTRKYMQFKTLSNKISTNHFGTTSALSNIDVYYFLINDQQSVDGYQMQFVNTAGKVKKNIVQTSSSFRVEGVVNGNFYKYRVRSYVECGTKKAYSAWSGYRYIGVTKKVTTGLRGSGIRFNWSNVAGASNYVVYMSTSENSGYKKIASTTAKKRNIAVTKYKGKKIQKNKKYYFKIETYAKNGKKKVKSEVILRFSVTKY